MKKTEAQKQAQKHGLKVFTFSPCKRCGNNEFYASNCACLTCNKEYARTYREANPETIKQQTKDWRRRNPDKLRKQGRDRADRINPERNRYTTINKQLSVRQSIINNPALTYKEIADIHEVGEGSVKYIASKFNIVRGNKWHTQSQAN